MSAPRTRLALLALLMCAWLSVGAASAAAPPAPRTAPASAHSARSHCLKRRQARRPRACRAVHRRASATGQRPKGRPGDTGSRAGRRATRPRATHRHRATTVSASPPRPAPALPSAAQADTAPCANADLTPTTDNLPVVETATLCLINQVRAQNRLAALVPNANLQAAAERHNNDMVVRNYFDHPGPAGDTPGSRIQDSGYLANPDSGYEVGENIAWGTGADSTPRVIVDAWVHSPDHLANILEAKYADSGLAVAAQAPASVSGGQAGAIYTQDFGGINRG